jgi:RHS repeat-associated protein
LRRHNSHADHLNTPRLVANQSGQTVWRWDQQEPFGVTVPDENPSGLGAFEFPLRFPGQYFDRETNVHYNYYRDYDPSIGRYAESDPIGLRARLNTYAYVDGDPIALADPFGLKPMCYEGVGIRCHSDQLSPTDKLPAPLPKDPRDSSPKNKPDPDFCAKTQAILANCQQCCTRIAQTFRDAYFPTPCNISCNDKFACRPSPPIAGLGLGSSPDLLLVF